MNNWKYPEEQLRKWTPRPASPELRRRLFAPAAPAKAAARTIGDFSRFIVPAFGCFMLVVGSLSQRLPDSMTSGGSASWAGRGHAGDSRIILAEARKLSEINAIPATRMEYSISKPALAQPDRTSLPPYTNQLIQQ